MKILDLNGSAEWLVEQLKANRITLVGIDHGFSFSLLYFEAHHSSPDWAKFLDDLQHHLPADQHDAYSAAEWKRRNDLDGTLSSFFNPPLRHVERVVAQVEGWIPGISDF